MVGLGAGIFGMAWWLTGGFGRGKAPVLTSELEPEQAAPALRLVVPPGPVSEHANTTPARVTPPVPDSMVEKPSASAPTPPLASPVAATQPAYRLDPQQAAADLQAGLEANARGDAVRARELINRALHSGLMGDPAARAREALADLGERLVFSRIAAPNDPLVESYTVAAGNSLGRLSRRFKVSEDFLAELNGITDKRFIREGARLKMVHGPFHASISKSNHLMHIYLQDVYVKTMRVALGADGRTPVGKWRVANHQVNPGWTDPRTGKRWHPDDPANPIGDFWIGLEGVEGPAVGQVGYGIHGTNEPDTIGKDVSLGCVRLGEQDIAFAYKLLVPNESYVTIVE